MKILIADDDHLIRTMLEAILSPYAELHMAADGAGAVEIFRANLQERNDEFDLVIMDLNMPRMDGHDAMREIRNLETRYGVLPIDMCQVFVLTAGDEKDIVVDSILKVEVTAFLKKPLDCRELFQALVDCELLTQDLVEAKGMQCPEPN